MPHLQQAGTLAATLNAIIMNEFNFHHFRNNIEGDLREARGLVSNLSEYLNYPYGSEEFYFNEKKDFDEVTLQFYIDRAILKLKFALEHLQLDKLHKDFISALSKYKTYHDEFEHISYVGVFTNPVVGIIQMYVDAVCSQLDPAVITKSKIEEENSLLERILMGTPKLISDSKIEPSNEAEIRNMVREIPISKISKVYKPDIGIRKLKTAIEYKFADSLDEVKKSIGGIFEDIQGYAGSEDWTTFYAVIYQTDHFLTQSQVEEEFKLSGVEHNWKPILVYGKGARIKKRRKQQPTFAY
jgi:hypothetical protein